MALGVKASTYEFEGDTNIQPTTEVSERNEERVIGTGGKEILVT